MFTQEELNKLTELITIHQSKLAFDGKDREVEFYETIKDKVIQLSRLNIRF